MSQDFEKVLVKDDRLMVTDKIKYAVHKGGQQMTAAQFNAISQSTSSHTYNIQIPSENTAVDRRIMWQSTVTLKIQVNPAGTEIDGFDTRPVGSLPINYGTQDALSPFPLHNLCTVMTATINNNSVSINIRDVLPAILRFHDKRDLARYNGMTPTMYDTYYDYKDGLGANNNVLGGWSLTADNDLSQRGSWVLDSVSSNATSYVALKPTDNVAYVTFTVTEPLLLSPFIYGNCKSNSQAFYGIQNANFIFNVGSGDRVWRSANNWNQQVSVYGFNNSRLLFNFLTFHPSDLVPSRNIVPYYELPRYISPNQPTFLPNQTLTLRSQSLQLNQIPDKLIIFVRKAMSDQRPNDSDSFLVINNISINFNNSSGILASASQNDLYRYSIENGSNQSFYEFSGGASTSTSLLADVSGNNPPGSGTRIPLTGSLLVLDFAKDIQLVDDFYSCGSLGNFNLQFNLTCTNQSKNTLNNTEIVVITMNSGIWVNERGTSTVYTGILTKQDVLDASTQEAYTRSDVRRMVGGGFLDTLKSVTGKLLPKLPSLAKVGLSMVPDSSPMGKYAKMGEAGLGALGYGRSGGGSSGGARHRLESRLQ